MRILILLLVFFNTVVVRADNLCEVGDNIHSLLNTLQKNSNLGGLLCSSSETTEQNKSTKWLLYWQADLSSAEKFKNEWEPSDCGGFCGNDLEKQYYANSNENLKFTANGMQIIAKKESYKGREYTSGRFASKKIFQYGKFEFKAKMPKGNGLWAAGWMLPAKQTYGDKYWPDNGEIDVLEYFSNNKKSAMSAVYTNAVNHVAKNSHPFEVEGKTFDDEYHTYAVEWSPKALRFFVDGKFTGEYKNKGEGWKQWPFDKPFNLMVNMAVGSHVDPGNIDLSKGPAVDFASIKVYAPVGGDFCTPATDSASEKIFADKN